MSVLQLAFLALVFLLVFGSAYAVMVRFAADPVQGRLQQVTDRPSAGVRRQRINSTLLSRIAQWLAPLAKLSGETEEYEHSPLRLRFMTAGLRHSSMGVLYFSAKTALAVMLPPTSLSRLAASAGSMAMHSSGVFMSSSHPYSRISAAGA